MQYLEKTMTISLTFFGGEVKQKMTLHDKGGRGGKAKSDFCDEGEEGVQTPPNLHNVIKVQPLI